MADDRDDMVTVCAYVHPGKRGRLEVLAHPEDAAWLRALFEHHPAPFQVLNGALEPAEDDS